MQVRVRTIGDSAVAAVKRAAAKAIEALSR